MGKTRIDMSFQQKPHDNESSYQLSIPGSTTTAHNLPTEQSSPMIDSCGDKVPSSQDFVPGQALSEESRRALEEYEKLFKNRYSRGESRFGSIRISHSSSPRWYALYPLSFVLIREFLGPEQHDLLRSWCFQRIGPSQLTLCLGDFENWWSLFSMVRVLVNSSQSI